MVSIYDIIAGKKETGMAEKDKVLVVEDDEDIRLVEETYLQTAGYEAKMLPDGNNIMDILEKEPFDLILLDLMLPGKNGYEICEEVRKKYDIPILMVTARTQSLDKIRGFGSGADDYISKPFDPMELVARVNANIRQYKRLKSASSQEEGREKEIRIGDLRILPDSWRVYKKDKEITLPHREFELLAFLAENPDIVFSKEQLMDKVWGYDYSGDSATVMVHINRLREKIEDDPQDPRYIETVWGAGYRMCRPS